MINTGRAKDYLIVYTDPDTVPAAAVHNKQKFKSLSETKSMAVGHITIHCGPRKTDPLKVLQRMFANINQ